MGNKYAGKENDQNEENVIYSPGKGNKVKRARARCISESETWNLVKAIKPGTMIPNLTQSETSERWLQELLLKRSRGIGIRVPKHLVSLDEKYLRRCLEVMHSNALKGTSCASSVNLSSSDMGFVPDYVTIARNSSLERTKQAIDYPMVEGNGDLDASAIDKGIIGSIMESKSMMSILRSPLFQRVGNSDHDAKLGRTSIFENKRCIAPDYQGSPGRLCFSPSQKPRKKTLAFRNQEYVSDSVQQSPISISSGLSIPTDESSASSFSPSDSQGMLQCTWEGGIPHFAFCLDDQKELYVAKASKVEVANDKALDYVYSFHLKPSGQKIDFSDNEADLVGKMKVSTSFSICPSNSRVVETEFVLVGPYENHAWEMHASTLHKRQAKKLPKVMEVFKAGHTFKQQTPALFGGIPENFCARKGSDLCNSMNQQRRDIDFTPNLELAAIVVKDHIPHKQSEKEEVGGWGLKFLKKAEIQQSNVSSDVPAPSECCLRNESKCSTSMEIIVPAGHHGGPTTKDGGPTCLIERWRLGGHCDCGGWDVGCPLKVLKAKPTRQAGWPSSESSGDCKSFDVFTEGSKQGKPTLKMVNIQEGLYFISFQPSSLSPLQCFSTAVAIIHAGSPSLRPKHVHDRF